MAFYLSPLVDVNEIDLSTTIPAVATSIGVIALRETYKGAEKKQTFVTDENDLISAFGEPTNDSYQDLLAASGFLKYGNKLYATRVANENAEFSSMSVGTGVGSGLTLNVTANDDGVITEITVAPEAEGIGYVAGEYLTIDGNDVSEQDAVVWVLAVDNVGGAIQFVLVAGGSGYTTTTGVSTTTIIVGNGLVVGGYIVGDVVTVTGGNDDATLTIDMVDVEGKVLTFTISDGGTSYSVGTAIETTGGSGTGFTVDITDDGIIDASELTINNIGSGYTASDVVTVTGGNGDATLTVLTVDTGGEVLTYEVTTGGTGYVDGNLPTAGGTGSGFELVFIDGDGILTTGEVIVNVGGVEGVDINGQALDFSILPSEDPDDFGDEVQVSTLTDYFWFISSSRGTWGNKVRVAFMDYETQKGMLDGTLDSTKYGTAYSAFSEIDSQLSTKKDFLVMVQEMPQRKSVWVTRETFNVSTDPNALDDTGGKRYVEDIINQQSQYIRVSADVSSITDQDFPTAISQDVFYQFVGGSDGTGVPTDGDIIEAYRLYEDPETVDVNLILDAGKSETVKSDLIAMCEERLDCMTVLDVPMNLVVNNKGNETINLRDWRNGTGSFVSGGFNENTSYASIYGNWIEVYDKYNQKYRWIPASGHIAGIYAKTDDVADPWWAPAGLNRAVLTGVRRLAWNPKLGNRDILYANGINPIVSFAGQGKVVWGQKTMLAKSSAFNRVNVRRLFIVLEKAISTAAKYFLFEPNDVITRNLLVNMINPFLRDVQSRRGIYDFRVICDESNNTPERIDRNELWCDILIKPTRTAEFIVLNFVATKTGASFEEAAAAV